MAVSDGDKAIQALRDFGKRSRELIDKTMQPSLDRLERLADEIHDLRLR